MDRRRFSLTALLAFFPFAAKAAAPKYRYEIVLRPIDNGWLLKLYDRQPSESTASPIGEPEVVAVTTDQAAAVIKLWCEALK